jgi:starch synthase
LFGVVSRLSDQKGLDLLLQVLPGVVAKGGQLALLGSGEPSLEAGFAAAAGARPDSVGCVFGYDEMLAHLIQAGADFIVVPSRFEPCGLTQLCALRYGAPPAVARVGGLADTVIDANEAAMAAGVATGFQFHPSSVDALSHALDRALTVSRDPAVMRRMRLNGMRSDVSWRGPAKRYAALYRALAGAQE